MALSNHIDRIEMLSARVLSVKIAAGDIQADKVDTKFLNEGHPRSAGKANGPTIVLEFHDRGFPNKVFDRNDRDLDIPVLKWNIKLGPIVQLMSDSDLATVRDVTAGGIGVADAALGSSARPNAVARESALQQLAMVTKDPLSTIAQTRLDDLSIDLRELDLRSTKCSKFIEVSFSICFRALVDFSRFAPQNIFSSLSTSSSVSTTNSFFFERLSDFLVTRWAQASRSAVAALMVGAGSRIIECQHRHRTRQRKSCWSQWGTMGGNSWSRSERITA